MNNDPYPAIDETHVQDSQPFQDRPKRTRKAPSYLKDYVRTIITSASDREEKEEGATPWAFA